MELLRTNFRGATNEKHRFERSWQGEARAGNPSLTNIADRMFLPKTSDFACLLAAPKGFCHLEM